MTANDTSGSGTSDVAAPSTTVDGTPVAAVVHPPADMRMSRKVLWAKPLRVHLSVLIVILLVSISIPLMWLTWHQGKRSALDGAEQRMRLLSEHVIDRYRGVFGDGFSAASTASVLETLLQPPPDRIQAKTDFLIKALESSAYIDGIFVGYPDGGFVHAVSVGTNPRWADVLKAPSGTVFALRTIETPPSGQRMSIWRFLDADGRELDRRWTVDVPYDPRKRPWFKAALKEGGPVTVGPYVMATTKSLGLTLALPMAKNTSVIVGVDVLLETISRLLAREAVSENARGYVFDDQKKLIVHSDQAVMDRILDSLSTTPRSGQSLDELDPALDEVKELLRVTRDDKDRSAEFLVDGVPHIAWIASVRFSDLVDGNTVVIVAPLSDFTGQSFLLLKRTMLIAAIFVIAGILAALLVARIISTALKRLTEDARQIGNLEFEGGWKGTSWISEINTLAVALGSAREAIGTFALYVPRELVRKIIDSGQATAGKALRHEVTILFTDIRDFTTISEQHSPEEVVDMLSVYFELMNRIVEGHNGVIIQYLGDSIYAMWNAPALDSHHVDDACRCALALKDAIDKFNAETRAAGLPELVTRFGLHTGPVVVGSVGAAARRQYTAMGDTVNVASRLEGMNKQFGTTILASGEVRRRSETSFVFRPLGFAQAKGRAEEIEICELVSAQ